MADFRFRICNELLDEEDEDSAFIINFTPSTFKKAKEKLRTGPFPRKRTDQPFLTRVRG